MEIIQIVGYKNSGKTSLAGALIEKLTNQGIRVASLKHHGHGGAPLGMEDTDSAKLQQSGAIISGVEGDRVLQLSSQQTWNIEQMLAIYKLMDIEVVIMEGFKELDYKKVVLIKKQEELHLFEQLTNIKAVLTPLELKQEGRHPYPTFKRTEMDALVERILNEFFQ